MTEICINTGAAAKGCNPAGKQCALKKMYEVYFGSSAGALTNLLLSMEKYDELAYEQTHTTNRQMYGAFPPINKHGELSIGKLLAASSVALMRRRNYIYHFGKVLDKKVRKYFSKEDFYRLKRRGIHMYVTNHLYRKPNDEPVYLNNQDELMTHDQYVRGLVASSSIPFLAKPVVVQAEKSGDGGIKDAIPTSKLSDFPDAKVDIWLSNSLRDEEGIEKDISTLGRLTVAVLGSIKHHMRFNDLRLVTNPNTTLHYADPMSWDSANFDPVLMKAGFDKGVESIQNGQHQTLSIQAWRKLKKLNPLPLGL